MTERKLPRQSASETSGRSASDTTSAIRMAAVADRSRTHPVDRQQPGMHQLALRAAAVALVALPLPWFRATAAAQDAPATYIAVPVSVEYSLHFDVVAESALDEFVRCSQGGATLATVPPDHPSARVRRCLPVLSTSRELSAVWVALISRARARSPQKHVTYSNIRRRDASIRARAPRRAASLAMMSAFVLKLLERRAHRIGSSKIAGVVHV